MSKKRVTETTSQKILNSDIYDITRFVDDIKKRNIDGIEEKETLMVGMYGYLGYQFSSLLQNAIVTASELSNEAIPTRAKFDRNVITHALSLGVEKVAATPANMKVLLMFPEKALRANMVDGEFTLTADTPLRFDEFEFHTDYDITIKYTDLTSSTNGSQRNYVYTATYDMTHKNPISDLDNPFLPPIAIFNYEEDNMVVLSTNLHQVYYKQIFEKILDSDVIANKTINFSFDKQMSHFNIIVKEPSSSEFSEENTVYLNAVYDGLYNQEIAGQKYCYYQYINSNTIRIRFDPTNYQPPTNSELIIECYTTDGNGGNFEYSEEKTIRLTSNKYTNLYCIIAQRGDDGSSGGLDRQSIEQLQHIIPKEALSRGSITTLTDLKNFFNSLNNENSVLHVFRKEDNILDRIYYVYNLMKDTEQNIVPTNTIPIYIESSRRDAHNGKIYLESGTPIFYYKFGKGADLPLLKNNFMGYLQQKVANVDTCYSFYNEDGLTTYQGTPTIESMEEWYNNYKTSFDHDKLIEDFEYETKKPPLSYDFHENGSIYFKPLYLPNTSSIQIPNNPGVYENWFYGTCRRCRLSKAKLNLQNIVFPKLFIGKDFYSDIFDLEIEWQEISGSITTTVHFPKRNGEIDPATVVIKDTDGNIISTNTGKYISIEVIKTPIEGTEEFKYIINDIRLSEKYIQYIKNVRFYRTRLFDSGNNIIGQSDKCEIELPIEHDKYDINVLIYAWFMELSFKDNTKSFSMIHGSPNPTAALRTFFVPDYFTDLSNLDVNNKKLYAELMLTSLLRPYIDESNSVLILDSINTIDVYSYDGQGDYGFDSLTLTEGDLIRFSTYLEGESSKDFIYSDPTTWTLGEVLSIEKLDGRIVSIEVLTKDEELGAFNNQRYILPVPIANDYDRPKMDSSYITLICKITKFLYTTPLSIILKDDPTVNTHRITASYYLDIINETRYQNFDCINSKSPIQFILPSIRTYRSSYLSDNRYKYTIKINIKPNTGTVDMNMINRTQVIGVFYKKSVSETSAVRPIMYSIADYVGGDKLENVNPENGIPYEINLYTRPFTTSTDDDRERERTDIIDDNNNLYIGPKKLIEDIALEIGGDAPLTSDDAKKLFWKKYKCYYATANSNNARPLNYEDFDLENLPPYYSDTIYLNLNTEFKIYILYKYDTISPKAYTDGLTNEFLAVNTAKVDALYNSVPQSTMFKQTIDVPREDPAYIDDYSLKQMVLTNVYSTYQGINLLYDYSNIMNSYVTSIKTNDIFNPDNEQIESYIINRVPCLRYFYWNIEERVLDFIKEMKKKINYVLDAIAPLECTFGLDYKFFNTYGPSNMYHLTDDDGDVTDLIDNVALTMTFRAKFYNEDSDAEDIIGRIKNSIKDYLEKLDQLDDIHFPNITTMIETEYSEHLIYFEFVSFNIYDATTQHIITVENMEMLSMVPEFLHVDTNDHNGLPYINIRLVT